MQLLEVLCPCASISGPAFCKRKPRMKICCQPNLLLSLLALMVSIAATRTANCDPEDHLLVLDTSICQGDMYEIGQCLNRQNEKADRWLHAIVQSYASLAAAYMSEPGEDAPFDQVAQLRESQARFEQFRDATAELVYRAGYPGSGSSLESAKARFRLTVERARFLLDICDYPGRTSLHDVADLTVTDWCHVL